MIWIVVRAALIVAAGLLVGSWLEGVARGSLDRKALDPSVREVLVRVVRPLVIGLAALVAVASLGLDATGAVAVVAALVLAVGFSAREALANGAAGALLLTWRPYRPGDIVALAGFEGVVTDLSWFATTLKTADGRHVTVPNRHVLGGGVENLTRNGLLRVDAVVPVAPGADFEALAAAVLRRVAADPRFSAEPAPVLGAERVDARALTVRLSAWARPEQAEAARSALVLAVRDAAAEAKIALAGP